VCSTSSHEMLALVRSSWNVLRHVFFGRLLLHLPSSGVMTLQPSRVDGLVDAVCGLYVHRTKYVLRRTTVGRDSWHVDDSVAATLNIHVIRVVTHIRLISTDQLMVCKSFVAISRKSLKWKLGSSDREIPWMAGWYLTQFPSCCTQNMELFTATSPFANHQPTTVPVSAQNSSLQTRLHMTFTSENYWGVNLLTYLTTLSAQMIVSWAYELYLVRQNKVAP